MRIKGDNTNPTKFQMDAYSKKVITGLPASMKQANRSKY